MGKCFTFLHPRRKLSLEIKILTFSQAGLEVINSSALIIYVLKVQVLLRSCQTNLISSYILPFPLLHYLAQIEPFWRQYTTRWMVTLIGMHSCKGWFAHFLCIHVLWPLLPRRCSYSVVLIWTPKTINFPFSSNAKLMVFRCPNIQAN